MRFGMLFVAILSLRLEAGTPGAGTPGTGTPSAATPTFHRDIEPILQKRCQSCHRDGEAAPMPLLTYDQTRPWAKAIRASVLNGKMPPWQPDPHYGKFSNDLSLAPGEKEKLIAWV